ncbi:uncharacterized protein LOC123545365 [Mercenaria mercenaria]|uniref:uncharacterized protein LOC123545365 n=1 Tax=Mercenaria mercenaria TaxID=6596 RepID=UPI00234F12CC|nr:uncharacterized protein LOC123545365 [Mercenaria mercenaria]
MQSCTSVRAEGFTTFSGYLLWKTPASVNSINVAFHTYLSRNINDLGKWNTIPFDQMLINEHQGYDNITQHAFTCPVNGVYMFQSSIMSSFGVIEAEIVKDAVPFVRVYASANGLSNDQHDQGFNAGIVRCNKNQKVWVRVSQGTSILQYLFSTFSGYLMWELEEASTIAGITGREINVNNTHVAFNSYLSNGATGLGKEQAIPFDMTPLNEGNRFDNGFYTFLCPVNGIYVFQSAVMVNVSHVETEIVKDRIPIARMYAGVNNQGGISHFDQGFNSGIVNCNHNERVWVRTGNQSSSTVDHRKTTTFSGFLLKKF